MTERFCRAAVLLLLLLTAHAAGAEMPVIEDEMIDQVHIRVAGDIMMHQRQLDIARREDGSYDCMQPFEYVRETLAGADLTIGNLETVVDPSRPCTGYPVFNSPEALPEALKECGVDFLTLANNHILDGYFDGALATVDVLDRCGIAHGGVYRTEEESREPVLMTVNSITVGFLCYTESTNGMERYSYRAAREYGIGYLDSADFTQDVRRLRDAGAEFILALVHWGTEYETDVEASVRRKAVQMAKAGVDMIIGSHPHVVRTMEYLTVETGDTSRTVPVAWSIGNFISNQNWTYSDEGIIVDFRLERAPDGSVRAAGIGYIPVFVWNREGGIQVLCSGEYLETGEPKVSSDVQQRIRNSCKHLRKLIPEEFECRNG